MPCCFCSLCLRGFRVVSGNNIIKPVNQLWFPERDVRGALLKVSDAEHLIFIALLTLNGLNVVIQTDDDIFPVVGDGPAAEQVQHPFGSAIRSACCPVIR